MSTRKRLPRYQVYLLRCWVEQPATASDGDWRFSLENPHTSQRQGFPDLAALLTFLQAEFASQLQAMAEPSEDTQGILT